MNILIMGGPGAGKGSQAQLIKEKYKLIHISSGDMFRTAIKNETTLGKSVINYTTKGELVPNDITSKMINERLLEDDIKNGFILDGYPRNIEQAINLDQTLIEYGLKIDVVLNIVSDDETLVRRISGRRTCSYCKEGYHIDNKKPKVEGVCDICGNPLFIREDDNVKTVKRRIAIYYKQTAPLLKHYQKLVVNISGEGYIEDTFQRVSKVLALYD
jgi:adenylate kinase